MAGSCKCANKPSVSIKCREFFWLAEELLVFQEGFCSLEFGVFILKLL
jgi:hypothetical protein